MKFIAVFVIGILTSNNSVACSCDTISFEKATDWADEIFYGRIIQVREVISFIDKPELIDLDDTTTYGFEYKRTRIWGALFEIEKKWKGSSKKYVEVFQPNTSCDFFFNFPDDPYIVYAKRAELIEWDSTQSFVGLGTWLCARNASRSIYSNWNDKGFDDRQRLNEKYPIPVKLSSINLNWRWLIIGITLFFSGLISGFIIKKRNANNGSCCTTTK